MEANLFSSDKESGLAKKETERAIVPKTFLALHPAICFPRNISKSPRSISNLDVRRCSQLVTIASLTVFLQAPNTKRFKRTLIYFNTDTQYANFRGNPLYQAKKQGVLAVSDK